MSRQTIERALDVGGDKPAHQFSAPAAREIGIDQGALLHRCLVEPRGIELHPEHLGFPGLLFPQVNQPTLLPTL